MVLMIERSLICVVLSKLRVMILIMWILVRIMVMRIAKLTGSTALIPRHVVETVILFQK